MNNIVPLAIAVLMSALTVGGQSTIQPIMNLTPIPTPNPTLGSNGCCQKFDDVKCVMCEFQLPYIDACSACPDCYGCKKVEDIWNQLRKVDAELKAIKKALKRDYLNKNATMQWVDDQKNATMQWVSDQGYATGNWVSGQGYATKGYVTAKTDATKTFVQNQNYATESFVTSKTYATESFVKKQNDATKNFFKNQKYATESFVTSKTDATKNFVKNQKYATESFVMSKKYATMTYAKYQGNKAYDQAKTYADTQGFATEKWVQNKNYATQQWVQGNRYATEQWVNNKGYATGNWVHAQGYLKKEKLQKYPTEYKLTTGNTSNTNRKLIAEDTGFCQLSKVQFRIEAYGDIDDNHRCHLKKQQYGNKYYYFLEAYALYGGYSGYSTETVCEARCWTF